MTLPSSRPSSTSAILAVLLLLFVFPTKQVLATPVAFQYLNSSCINGVSLSDQKLICGSNSNDDTICQPGLDTFVSVAGTVTLPSGLSVSSFNASARVCLINIANLHLLCYELGQTTVDLCNSNGLGLSPLDNSVTCPEAGTYTFGVTRELVEYNIPFGNYANMLWSVAVVADFKEADGTLYTSCTAYFKEVAGVEMTIGFIGFAFAISMLLAAFIIRRNRGQRTTEVLVLDRNDGPEPENYNSNFVELADRGTVV